MQNIEATLFIHVIANRIRQEKPDLPIYTIHDSVLTVPRAVNYVRTVIRDEFNQIGVYPTLKEETYDGG